MDHAIPNLTADILYEVPLMLEREGLADVVVQAAGPDLPRPRPHRVGHHGRTGPRTSTARSPSRWWASTWQLHDAYLSVVEALTHGGIENDVKVHIQWVDSETVTDDNAAELLKDAHGILVPGGFGDRGIEGKISAIRYARENDVPFLGICLGMQMAVVEFARHVCGMTDAHSSELNPDTTHPVIDLMPEQVGVTAKGGTMRLGSYPCHLKEGTPGRRDLRHAGDQRASPPPL